jgi:uncharacterized protein YecE (DUF72 family)
VEPTVPEQDVDELYSATPTKTPVGEGVHAALQAATVEKQVPPPHVEHPVKDTDAHWQEGLVEPLPLGQNPLPKVWQMSHWLNAKEEKRERIIKLSKSVDNMLGSVEKEGERERRARRLKKRRKKRKPSLKKQQVCKLFTRTELP